MIRFVLDGEIQELVDVDPTRTVLEWLREDEHRVGTKEGCAEGDCGACTAVIGELIEDRVRYRAINTCIYFLPMLHGKELVTVESIGVPDQLHPVQQAMADGDGTQCGFCTPGFVMSLFAKYQGSDPALSEDVDNVLAGNLCRCTGYRPIQEAAASVEPDAGLQARFGGPKTRDLLKSLHISEAQSAEYQDPHFETARRWHRPTSEEELTDLLKRYPSATLVAGATDVGLWVTKQHRLIETAIVLNGVTSLNRIEETEQGLRIGAMVTYSDAIAHLARLHPDFGELVRRIGSTQVRNSGTIGGNIANGSPIGDTPPPLIVLNAQLELASSEGARTIPLEDFFIDYGKQDLRTGEYVRSVLIPPLADGLVFRTYKISKRFNQDISALCGAFAFEIEDGVVTSARVAFGGMAATPKRAAACEAALTGQPWTEATIDEAANAMARDYAPITDMRASAPYRMKTAQNLLRKAFLETGAPNRTRILEGVRL
ncbi:MAG: xanthine dehydrogenase small subunit [Henriciella sp.]|nr:xanthine dehydrogenase small subunit [Henriciella sp.]